MHGEVSMYSVVEVKVDAKGRIYLPFFTKPEAEEELIFMKKPDYVEVWTSDTIVERVNKLNDFACYETDTTKRAEYQRMSDEITAFLKKVRVEKDGKRIALGKDIITEYHFSDSIFIEGKGNCIRLWEPNKFLEYQQVLLDEKSSGIGSR